MKINFTIPAIHFEADVQHGDEEKVESAALLLRNAGERIEAAIAMAIEREVRTMMPEIHWKVMNKADEEESE